MTGWFRWINFCFEQTKCELQQPGGENILDQDGCKRQFTNNLPGRDWWQWFLQRHPKLTERQGETLGKECAQLTHEKVNAWYEEFESYVKDREDLKGKGEEVLKDPTRLLNCSIVMNMGSPFWENRKVLVPLGSKNVYQLTASDKRQITVLACMNAASLYLPPMLILSWAPISIWSSKRLPSRQV